MYIKVLTSWVFFKLKLILSVCIPPIIKNMEAYLELFNDFEGHDYAKVKTQ